MLGSSEETTVRIIGVVSMWRSAGETHHLLEERLKGKRLAADG
jgi:hypothetical protein